MVVPALIKDIRVVALIDTGSQVTMANSQVCQAAGLDLTNGHTIQIFGVGQDMGMSAKVITGVPISVGNGVYPWTLVIGNIRDDLILGLDFLHAVGALLNFDQGYLKIGDAIIVSKYVANSVNTKMALSPVRVNEKAKLSGLHCQNVVCDIPDVLEEGEFLLIEPVPTDSPIMFPSLVVSIAPHIALPVANLSESTISLPVGCVIGIATKVTQVIATDDWYRRSAATNDADKIMPSVANDIFGTGSVGCSMSVPIPEGCVHSPPSDPVDPHTALSSQVDACVEDDGGIVPQTCKNSDPSILKSDIASIPDHLSSLYHRSTENLNGEEECEVVRNLLCEYSDVFAKHNFDLGEFSKIMHRIDTGTAPPVRHGLRRTPLGFQDQEEAHLRTMVEHGIIQPSSSEWAAAPVIVRKKDGTFRYCVDYRSLNNLTRKDGFPLPLIEECLDALADTEFFSTLDMASGYWQVVIHPDDRHKTAFITKYGLYEHVRLAMGLCNSPATYQRIMTYVLQNMLWKDVLVYLDDLIILGQTFSSHVAALREVFKRFRENNLKFKPKKCELFKTEVDFLGRRVGRTGVSIPDAKIQAVLDWSVPTTKTELESFLGFINYHRDFIPHMAEICDVLYKLVRDSHPKEPLSWQNCHQWSFDKLKQAMVSAPVLSYPNSTGTFILDVDASDVAIGAELLQIQNDQERVIAYSSQSLAAAQRRYCTTRKELLSLVTFLNHFRFYLLGRSFLVRTDHNSLIWLMRFKNLEGQLARWLEAIAQFDFQIKHRAGRSHGNADGLSRLPEPDPCPFYDLDIDVRQLPCGGCSYCQRMHEQWSRFESFVDDVMPLTVRQTGIASGSETDLEVSAKPVDWAREQSNDPDLAILLRWKQAKEPPNGRTIFLQNATVKHLWRMREQLEIRDSVLMYRWLGHVPNSSKLLVIVPRHLRSRIMHDAHNNVCAGHPGPEKQYLQLINHFFWPGMRTDIRITISACEVCCRNKRVPRAPRASLTKFHAGEPMERVHVDILGPLTESPNGHKYILVMTDQFTKWTELAALSEQTAERIATALITEFICRMGCAQYVHSDQGANFEGHLFRETCELLQMAKTRTTPYRPSANGQVERVNREILAKLRSHVQGKPHQWDRYLPFVGMALRATVNRSTGFTANMMMLGREVSLPIDLVAPRPKGETPPPTTPGAYVQDLRDTLQSIHDCARNTLKTTLHDRKKYYDLKERSVVHQTGDLVYMLNSVSRKGVSRKLQPVYLGPLLIVNKLSSSLFVVVGPRGRRQVVHHDRLRPCSDRNIPLWARRERRKMSDSPVEELERTPDENADLGLAGLFQEQMREVPATPVGEPSGPSSPVPEDIHGENLNDTRNPVDSPDRESVPAFSSPSSGAPADVETPSGVSMSPMGASSDVHEERSPSVTQELPPTQFSGRRRRQPAWLKDFVRRVTP